MLVVLQAEEALGFVLLLAFIPTAIIYFLVFPSLALFGLTKKFKTTRPRAIAYLGYFGLLGILIGILFFAPMSQGRITSSTPYIIIDFLFLSLPLTYIAGTMLILIFNWFRNRNKNSGSI
jgi:hypothetical protein